MGTIYYYMRISTEEERGKQKYSRQEQAIKSYCRSNQIEYDEQDCYKDDCSGKSFDRPRWKKLISRLQAGDTIIMKDISRFTRADAEESYQVYMDLLNSGISLIFLDNPTVSSDYIKKMMGIAEEQSIVTKTALQGTIKLLLIVELDRVETERKTIVKRIKDGIQASPKQSGRPKGQIEKLSDDLQTDIKLYLSDRSIKQVDLMRKHQISRNTLKKYIQLMQQAN